MATPLPIVPVDIGARYNINQVHANMPDQGVSAKFEEEDKIEGVVYGVIERGSYTNIDAEGNKQAPEEVEGAQCRYNLQ